MRHIATLPSPSGPVRVCAEDGLVNISPLYTRLGSPPGKGPKTWLKSPTVREAIARYGPSSYRVTTGGVWVDGRLAVDYAAYILPGWSAGWDMAQVVSPTLTQAPKPAPTLASNPAPSPAPIPASATESPMSPAKATSRARKGRGLVPPESPEPFPVSKSGLRKALSEPKDPIWAHLRENFSQVYKAWSSACGRAGARQGKDFAIAAAAVKKALGQTGLGPDSLSLTQLSGYHLAISLIIEDLDRAKPRNLWEARSRMEQVAQRVSKVINPVLEPAEWGFSLGKSPDRETDSLPHSLYGEPDQASQGDDLSHRRT